MEQMHFMEDYRQLFDALLRHPLLIDHPELRSNFLQQYEQSKTRIKDLDSFIAAASTLAAFFCDGHTNLEIPYTQNDMCLATPCKWCNDKLITTAEYKSIPKGVQITAIEGVQIGTILDRLATTIPHENIYLVKSRMVEYPYRNYHVFSDLNLKLFFGKKSEYNVAYNINDNSYFAKLALAPYTGFLDFCDDDFVSWEICDGHATLRLDACIFNSSYEEALAQLADACKKQNVTSLTLDLSRNMGGTSEVIEKFLEYVDIDFFHRYQMTDYSNGIAEEICSRTELVQNTKRKCCFPKQIFCKVGHTTFSSARTFAVTLRDNGIATIIGDATGGKPSSYGMPRKLTLNNTGIRFRVSRAWFGRPNSSLDHEETLAPD